MAAVFQIASKTSLLLLFCLLVDVGTAELDEPFLSGNISTNSYSNPDKVTVAGARQGHCAMRDVCRRWVGTMGDKLTANCPYDGPAIAVTNASSLAILREHCPDLVGQVTKSADLCCSEEDIVVFDKSMDIIIKILGRCPSCLRNFRQLFCQFSCSPYQGDFVRASKILNDTKSGGRPYVAAAEYYLTSDFVYGFFNSCKNVQFGDIHAFQLLCGSVEWSKCTPKDLLHYLGSPLINPQVPFAMNFHFTDPPPTPYVAMNTTIVPCNLAPSDTSIPCSCQDCQSACIHVRPYPSGIVPPCHLLNIDCFAFVSGVSFVAFLLAILLFAIGNTLCRRKGRDTGEPIDNTVQPNRYSAGAISSVDGGGAATTVSTLETQCYQGAFGGHINEADITLWENTGAYLEDALCRAFTRWGRLCCRYPFFVLAFGLIVAAVSSSGMGMMRFTTDPVDLWSAPGSQAREEKHFFDKHFSPFYRTEQVIVTPRKGARFWQNPDDGKWTGPVLTLEFLKEAMKLQHHLSSLKGKLRNGSLVGLSDICFKPLRPDNNNCTVLSPLQYFQDDIAKMNPLGSGEDDFFGDFDDEYGEGSNDDPDDYLKHLEKCFAQPTQIACLGLYGGPIPPYVVVGGFNSTDAYLTARALVTTFVVNNHLQPELNEPAEAWEFEFIQYLNNFTHPNLTVSFMAERSIQDEIKRESQSDAFTVLISYLFMFGYIAFALGQYQVQGNDLSSLLVQSKIMLGVAGVVIVALSVTSSIGLYAYCGIPASMIILEVQPFLVLAVGVDNIFIFVQAYQRDRNFKRESRETRIGRISGEVIPSMLLSSLAECTCFFLGALSSMPAIKTFSLYAALAIFFDFFLQITCFLALFSLDIQRQESGRLEVVCCKRIVQDDEETYQDGFLYSIFKRFYAPFLMKTAVRVTTVVVFMGWLCSSVAVLDKIELGLDQKLAIPEDSYVLRHFIGLDNYLAAGPPVYFVVKGELDYGKRGYQNLICGSGGCPQDSILDQIYQAAQYRNRSRIAYPASSWLDDYFDWLRPGSKTPCCRLYDDEEHSFCPAKVSNSSCHACNVTYRKSRPIDKDFRKYLHYFLHDNPNDVCAKGGHAAYGNALSFDESGEKIVASYFMTYHSVLKHSDDFISAYVNARQIAENMTATIRKGLPEGSNVEVFPYSIFYVFYEQYLTIVKDAVLQLLLSLTAIFVVTTLFLGLDPWSASMICITIIMILINLMALMFWWEIGCNAISLVNLVMAVGISVEFCSHTVRAFAISVQPTRVDRARESLATMGSSVLSGITLTKFGGIVVLAFAHSQIFKVFYFRMYLGIVLIGAAHGLVFLPVMLSFIGPSVNRRKLLNKLEKEEQIYGCGGADNNSAPLGDDIDEEEEDTGDRPPATEALIDPTDRDDDIEEEEEDVVVFAPMDANANPRSATPHSQYENDGDRISSPRSNRRNSGLLETL